MCAEGVECGHGGEPGGLVRELLQESRAGVMVPRTSRVAVGIYSTNQFKINRVTTMCWAVLGVGATTVNQTKSLLS